MIFSNSRTSIVFKKSHVNSIKLRGKYFIDRQTNIHSEVDMSPIAWCSKNKERKKNRFILSNNAKQLLLYLWFVKRSMYDYSMSAVRYTENQNSGLH